MTYSYIKALHIIFIVTWFSGLFYIVRLFVYTVEAHSEVEPKRTILLEHLKLWMKRLWFGITWPSAIITLLLGSYFLHVYASDMPTWLWIKLGFVVSLYIYHYACHRIYLQLQRNDVRYTSQQLRVWNEVATIILVAVVFLVVLKNTLSMIYGLVGLITFAVILMVAIQIYKRTRAKNKI
uniref:Protoporphyrinogen IX oxidase n=1 Tax=Roseihalotalea indica TaxID=2867963 RepID=A0AA49GUX4_9BACT|nr:CopD family protein [Tunicatimonas sp. TK19036]